MDQDNINNQQAEGTGDESLNTSSVNNTGHNNTEGTHKKGGIHSNALYAASMGRAATAQVNHHDTSSLANTGTNISYEGPTAPGSGGSAGTGYTSGQPATGASIATDSDYEQASVSTSNNSTERQDDIAEDKEDEINEQR